MGKGLDKLLESFRPELKIDEEIVEREEKFQNEDKDRKKWLLEHIYLSEGDLDSLSISGRIIELSHYPQYKRYKRIRLEIKKKGTTYLQRAEDILKLALHNRMCNLGVYYRNEERGKYIIVEAVPAIVSLRNN